MGYLKAVIEAPFKTTASGQRAFFPFGALGRGRVLPDEQTERSVRRVIKCVYALAFASALLSILGRLDWRSICGIGVGLSAIYSVIIHAKVRALPFADERLGWCEAYRKTARNLGRWWCLSFCLMCVVFAGSAVLAAVTMDEGKAGIRPMLAFAALMLLSAIFYAWLAWLATQEG